MSDIFGFGTSRGCVYSGQSQVTVCSHFTFVLKTVLWHCFNDLINLQGKIRIVILLYGTQLDVIWLCFRADMRKLRQTTPFYIIPFNISE